MGGEVERRGRNVSACFSLGFDLLQAPSGWQRGGGEEHPRKGLQLFEFRKITACFHCLSVERYLGCDRKLSMELKNVRRKLQVLIAYSKAIRLWVKHNCWQDGCKEVSVRRWWGFESGPWDSRRWHWKIKKRGGVRWFRIQAVTSNSVLDIAVGCIEKEEKGAWGVWGYVSQTLLCLLTGCPSSALHGGTRTASCAQASVHTPQTGLYIWKDLNIRQILSAFWKYPQVFSLTTLSNFTALTHFSNADCILYINLGFFAGGLA